MIKYFVLYLKAKLECHPELVSLSKDVRNVMVRQAHHDTTMITLRKFLEINNTDKNLARLFTDAIAPAVIEIRHKIECGDLCHCGTENVYGEKQLALDVCSNQIVLDHLKKSGLVNIAASEELESEVEFKKAGKDEKDLFTVVFDPLDGSSLVDVNFAVGSIFGVYPAGSPIGRTGDDQLAACFAVYGPRTTLVLTLGKGTHEFRLNHKENEFFLSKENLKILPQAKYFAPGNLRAAAERDDYLKKIDEYIKKGMTLRYSGGMVPDINHILIKGNGVFSYPSYSATPEGKLRLLFECNPMALLVEQAGGGAIDEGGARILSKKITGLHTRTPIFIGSKSAL